MLNKMPWISPGNWITIGQYRTAPLPIRPIAPPVKKGSSTKKVLELIANNSGLKKAVESKADGSNDGKTLH
jgi:hypothetical protein